MLLQEMGRDICGAIALARWRKRAVSTIWGLGNINGNLATEEASIAKIK